MQNVRRVVVPMGHIHDRGTVRYDEALEAPRIAQVVLQQHLVGASCGIVNGVVGAHHGLHMSIHYGGAEGRQIGLFQIAWAYIHVEDMAQGLGAAMDRKVFACCNRLRMIGIIALYTVNKGDTHAAGQERIFSVRLLTAAPTWVAKDIDVRRPEGESVEDAMVALALSLIEFRATFR